MRSRDSANGTKQWSRRRFLLASGQTISLATLAAYGATLVDQVRFSLLRTRGKNQDHELLFLAPEDPVQWPEWRRQLAAWRESARQAVPFDDHRYADPHWAWTQRAYAVAMLMLWDNEILDRKRMSWDIETWLDRYSRDYSPPDVVVLWHNYPLSGLDSRTQYDYWEDLPGGIPALAKLIAHLHAREVRILLPFQPWAGHPPHAQTHAAAMAQLLRATDADGLFLDTADRPAPGFRAALDQVRPGLATMSEACAPLDTLSDHPLDWGQFVDDSSAPGVWRNRWFEQRRLTCETRRYHPLHTHEVQRAWMNGTSFLVWENVFGYWAGAAPRLQSLLRAMFPAQRHFAELFSQGRWTPLVAPARTSGVYASLWEYPQAGLRLWTLVNRNDHEVSGPLLNVPAVRGQLYADIIAGCRIRPRRAASGEVILAGQIRPQGIAGFVAGPRAAFGPELRAFLRAQAASEARADWRIPVWEGTHCKTSPPHTLISPPPEAEVRADRVPPGMVAIPVPEKAIELEFRYRMRECGFLAGRSDSLHVYDAFERTRSHWRRIQLQPYAVDLFPVTNADFARFLRETDYCPTQPRRFLAHWTNGQPPAGKENHPVVYVDLPDARAYARWAGKRLPSEEEWQFAAQGPDRRAYPWGNAYDSQRCNGGLAEGCPSDTTPVDAYPEGRSPFGVWDMCGNAWEWTESEYTDGHQRHAHLRGGSFYRPPGPSHWFFDQGPQRADWSAKMLLLWPGWDRCATIGFRCAVTLTS